MKNQSGFSELFERARKTKEFRKHKAAIEFASRLSSVLRRKGISRAEFARRIGSSGAYVTKVFRGDANFTLDTLEKLCSAADASVHIIVSDKDCDVRWFEVFSQLARGTNKAQTIFSDTSGWAEVAGTEFAIPGDPALPANDVEYPFAA